MVKNLPAKREPWVQSLGLEYPLEEDTETYFSIPAWRIPLNRGAWQATVHRVARSLTWLKWLSMHVNLRTMISALCGELPDVQAGFRKGRGTRDQIANIRWIIEKAREREKKKKERKKKQESSRKTSISALSTTPKPSTVWITINCGKFWRRWEYKTTWPASWETCMQVRKQQLELDMEQQTGSK